MEPNHRHLRAAAEAVARGWVQRFWWLGDRRCLLQAIGDAVGVKPSVNPLPMTLLRELDTTLMATGTYCVGKRTKARRAWALKTGNAALLQRVIYGWNDTPGRKKDEVILVLKTTADRLEAKERFWLRGVLARAIRPGAAWFDFDEAELELELDEAALAVA
jgi:hypothetical protein